MPKKISVAVSGPPRRTFTYLASAVGSELIPGQRLLVPFGRSKQVGFYLGLSQPAPGVELKEILKPLDAVSFFPDELFRLCLWISEYYFANPADCLSASLPPQLKKNRTASLYWSVNSSFDFPGPVRDLVQPGKRISAVILKKLTYLNKNLPKQLTKDGIITERWDEKAATVGKRIVGFKAAEHEVWRSFFGSQKFNPAPFENVKSRSELIDEGWTDYHIRKALRHGLLISQFDDDSFPLLDFIAPRENLLSIKLTDEQLRVYSKVKDELRSGFKTYLLHGVTGSGKTIVYCHLCRETLALGKTALVLTPEIALTSTTLAYFRGFFNEKVAVIHSAMTDKERLASWQGIRDGRFRIVVGPRSALFAPLPNLGLIIVDEEHDGSYKQDDPAPRFHGRDCAIMRGKINNIPVLLGSASPSLESYYHAKSGRYHLLEITRRPGTASLPIVDIVDMKKDRLRGDLPFLSFRLKKEIELRLEQKEQVILYLNRRGHSPQIKCLECGFIPSCPHCRIKLTYHKTGHKLSCHHCGYAEVQPHKCPKCGSSEFNYLGVGTQKVEEIVPRLFDTAIVSRLDSDSATGRRKAYEILNHFSQGKSNLLLGTQMVTKGLDMAGVTLVGVLSADYSLDLPDFRAPEKTFSRLLQVAGRSGRAQNKGAVIIQTYYPENEVIIDASRQDYAAFFARELESRRQFDYPPFTRLVNFILTSSDERTLEATSLTYRNRLHGELREKKVDHQLLGPAPCPLYYLRGRYRRHLFVKTRHVLKLAEVLTRWEEHEPRFKLPATVRLTVDVDPDSMM